MLIVSDSIIAEGGRIYVKATATLMDCESDAKIEVSAFAREPQDKKGMDESQITGTASSYARKYALNGLFLLDDTKDSDTDEHSRETEDRATEAQIKTIEKICNQHKIDLDGWLARENTTRGALTATDAGKMLQGLKAKYGDN